jgi:hypothetical protein
MKRAEIFVHRQLAGILTEIDTGYHFSYMPDYL